METKPLTQWAMDFFRHKDLVARRIVDLKEQTPWSFTIDFSTKKTHVQVVPVLQDLKETLGMLKAEMGDRAPVLVILNTKQNVQAITKGFQDLVKFHNLLQVIVANPNSLADTKWIIFPYTHSRIADPGSLKTGIQAMADMVDTVSEKQEKEFC